MTIIPYYTKYFAHELTRRCPSDSLEKLAGSLADAQVDLNPHQVEAALQYCRYASDYTAQNGGKPWRYVLIPHNAVLANMTADFLFQKYIQD